MGKTFFSIIINKGHKKEGKMSTVSIVVEPRLLNKELVSEKTWERLVNRVMKDHQKTREEAELIMDGAFGFLKLCASYPGNHLAPSKLVDIGWHTFLLYTKEYQAFCTLVARQFIHHEPNDGENMRLEKGGVNRVIQFMREKKIPFHPELWPCKETAASTDGCVGTNCAGGCVDCDDGN